VCVFVRVVCCFDAISLISCMALVFVVLVIVLCRVVVCDCFLFAAIAFGRLVVFVVVLFF